MSDSEQRRVVVTGMGAVTNIGCSVPDFWHALCHGRSGIGPITAFEQSDDWTVNIAGEIRDFTPVEALDRRELKRMDRFCQFGMNAAEEAAADCGIDFSTGDPTRRGVVIGSGIGGIITIEEGLRKLVEGGPRKIGPFTVPRLMVNACAGNVSIRHNLRGVNSATATACATGGHALGTAYQLIQRGDAEVIFAGGAEASISPLCLSAFAAMKALSTPQ
jgi:3-oxoacyl-[acyl-carrier-protein] synthase II